ncbi:MAG: hypothetical protein ACLQDY_02820 [Streptosporangiaceae bacterium]
MNRLIWPVAIVLAALILSAGVLTAYSLRHHPPASNGPSHPAVAASPSASSPHPINASKAASTLEMDPTLALRYAENGVGGCLQQAWDNAGYANMFDEYAGSGVVQFSTGTQQDPTGSTQARTLISVTVHQNGTLSANAALEHWGCQPYRFRPRGGVTAPSAPTMPRPPGLDKSGPLDVGCATQGNTATVTFYNPGSSTQTVGSFTLDWEFYNSDPDNGTPQGEDTYSGRWPVSSTNIATVTLSVPAMLSGDSSCAVAGWSQYGVSVQPGG